MSIHQYQFNNGNQAEKFFLISFSDSLHQHNDTLLSGRQLVRPEEELSYMQNVFSSCHFPSGINTQERNLIEQSIALLMMAQVADNEIFPYAQGQVLASLRPGVWSISWVRDAAFAIEAMSKTGLYKEAKAGLEFMLKAKPVNQINHYIHTDGKDYGVGVPYIISITRYFGNGREECDYAGNDGPNIELDGLGLFLTALYHYINESGDTEFLKKWLTEIETIANAIVHNITTNKVIRRDSGPWEHHLPGKEYVWTTGVNARGLQLLTILMKHAGMPFKKYEEAYLQLMEGIYKNFVVNNYYIKGNVQDNDPLSQHYFDAASIELFANGLIQDKKLFSTHMKEYNRHLRAVQDDKRGYIRFNSSNSYENQEWPFAGLRVAVAQLKLGNKKEAAKLINRITAFASRNNNQIPEILDNETNIYKGAIPMIGYGAGAYIIAVAEQKKNK